jgi:DNA-binding response OmpR family regulator
MKVLVVDDDPGIRSGLCAQVRSDGFDAVACGNGQEALEQLRAADGPQIVLVDWVLPDRPGVDVCRAVRTGGDRVVPYLIMLTVKKDARDVAEALDAGANDYVTKPFSMMELRARIRVGRRVVELHTALEQQVRSAEAALKEVKQLSRLLPVCCYCRKVRDDAEYWQEFEDYLGTHSDTRFTHGICPACAARLVKDGIAATQEEQQNP